MAFVLHEVDVDRLVAGIVGRSELTLHWHEPEDLEQHLRIEAWKLSVAFDPERGVAFGAWAATTLHKRCYDWVRSYRGRTTWKFSSHTYQRPRVELVPLDADRDQLERALADRPGDCSPDRDEDYRGLLESRDRCRAEDLAELGLDAA